MYRNLGLDLPGCAKLLHVTERTLHNWESGKHDIPFAAYKLLRLLNRMDRKGYRYCMPHNSDPTLQAEPWVSFSSGYIQRALKHQPKQGSKRPWKLYQNYVLDLLSLRFGSLRDRAMTFVR